MKAFGIDFIRQALEQTLLKEHLNNPNFVGGKDQISIKSFYEQVQTQEQVNRFVESWRDLENQENRASLIGNGIISLDENPTITNIKTGLIMPMTWRCVIRCTLEDRDLMVDTINNMIKKLKGRKVDIAEFTNGELFMVGTIGSHSGMTPQIESGDYLPYIVESTEQGVSDIQNTIDTLRTTYGIGQSLGTNPYFYVANEDGYIDTMLLDDTIVRTPTDGIIIAPLDMNFTKYKLSLSFDSIRTDEPKTLNGQEYMYISFSGSATLVDNDTQLGNDLSCVKVAVPQSGSTYSNYYLEPMEMPSQNAIEKTMSQLVSNKFLPNSHNDSLQPILQYSFVYSHSESILKDWFKLARYGVYNGNITSLSPNTIYNITEYWCSWGIVEPMTYKGKLVESIDNDNTESDVLTLQISMQIQGDNQ